MEALLIFLSVVAVAVWLGWPKPKAKSKPTALEEQPMTDLDQWAMEHGRLLVEQINESIKIANESANVDTKRSRIGVARQKLEQLQELTQQYPFLRLERTGDVIETLDRIESGIGCSTEPGAVDGQHYTNHVEEVKQLKREGRLEEAAALLLRLIDAVEAEAANHGPNWPVAPWYYEHLGIVYRKLKRKDLADRVAARYQALPGAVRK